MSVGFVHLKVHSEYSLADSIIRLRPLLDNCHARKIPAVAITDLCNMFAAIKFYKAALSTGIKPIFGSDLIIESNDQHYELTLLAKSNQGYQSIVELISRAYQQAHRENGIPIIPKTWLNDFDLSEVFILSGGLNGELKHSLSKSLTQAKKTAKSYIDLCGKNNFVIELQRIQKKEEEVYIKQALTLAKTIKIPVVATNNVRFLNTEDYDDHEIRVGIYQGYTILDETRKSGYTENQYLRSADEMSELFADIPESLSNSLAIAKRCNVTFNLGNPVLPKFDIPKDMTESSYFTKTAYSGLEERFQLLFSHKDQSTQQSIHSSYKARLQQEIDVICHMQFAGYFLIVADFIQWAKKNNIPVGPGRGSGAGSLVAYALKITDIDPIPYGLLFERFLNPERVSMPDFDIDFCMDGRDRVIDYVTQKYGKQSVAQIITYGSMSAKAVVRDVGRVLGQPYGFVDKIAKMIPNDLGTTLTEACAKGTVLYDYAKQDEAVDTILQSALKLEGLVRNVGKHAAGVVIAPSNVTDFSPTYCEEGTQQLVTQFDKKDVEEVGLTKFDFLGLRNLTIINNTVNIINHQRNQNNLSAIDINVIPMNDAKTFALLQKGETTGVFQLESTGMKELIKRLKPDCFEDIIALVALYRPGPLGSGMVDDFINRKHGRQSISYPHPALETVLKETYGTILYQEQVMQIAQILANYSLGSADLLRRAMGKKNPEEMAQQRQTFEAGALENGIDAERASAIFDVMEEFAKYGFNKSHSAAYALVSYQTAYLKACYPEAFMAAALSSDMDNTDKVVNFITECQHMGIKLGLPDINVSEYTFSVDEASALIYGLGAIKGVGSAAIEVILVERQKHGIFKDLYDFCLRVDLRKVNKRVCEALIYAGAFDKLQNNRATLLGCLEAAMKAAEQQKYSKNSGQVDLFGLNDDSSASIDKQNALEATTRTWSNRERLIYEKSVLGLFLSSHLIDEDRFWLNHLHTVPLNQIKASRQKQSVLLAGVIVSITARKTKTGNLMAILQIDDGLKRLDLVIFSELFQQTKDLLAIDQTVIVEGEASIDAYNDQLRINAKSITLIKNYVNTHVKGLEIIIALEEISNIATLLSQYQSDKANDKSIRIKVATEDFEVLIKSEKIRLSLYDFVTSFAQKRGHKAITLLK